MSLQLNICQQAHYLSYRMCATYSCHVFGATYWVTGLYRHHSFSVSV